jgi:hypothetical protein
VAAVLLFGLLAACGSPSATSTSQSAESAAAAVYPAGIKQFKNPAAAYNAGLYASYSMHNCCFIRQHASLTLDKPAGARAATLQFFVPDAVPYKSGQTITVSVAGASATGSSTAGKWIAVSLAMPPQYIARTAVPIEIVAAKSINPAKLGINADTRDLSVVLQRVDYR